MIYSKYILSDRLGTERFTPGKVFIYFLLDPVSKNVRYVGKSQEPRVRYQKYMSDFATGRDPHLPVHRWVKRLRGADRHPLMRLVELVDEAPDVWEPREKHWIAHFRKKGYRLLNILEGGGGSSGFSMSRVVKAKISKALMGHVVSDETRRRMFDGRDNYGLSSIKGVSYSKKAELWLAQGTFCGIRCHVGSSKEESAAAVLLTAAKKLPEKEALKRFGPHATARPEKWTPEKRAALSAKKRLLPTKDGSVRGVRFNGETGKWQAEVTINGVRKHLGSFPTQEAAVQARFSALKN